MTAGLRSVDTQVLTLEYIENNEYQFSIPCYQRPYVWPDEAVLKLFDDIKRAQEDGESNYFIGTVLTALNQGGSVYELIDGQQRTTTLMLIAIAFRKVEINKNLAETKISSLAVIGDEPRLHFDIRDPVQHLIGSLAGLDDYQFPGDEAISKNPYLKRLYAALKVLEQQVGALEETSRVILGDYIYSNVQWVNNVVPNEMDLNRMFSTMNTAGIQLEQPDILKSKLFRQIKSEKSLYEAMWSCCEHMENYFERNVKSVFPSADWDGIEERALTYFDKGLFSKESTEKSGGFSGLTISELYEVESNSKVDEEVGERKGGERKGGDKGGSDNNDIDKETVYCRPIIDFSLLLIHAYRIYLAKYGYDDIAPRVHSAKLIECFESLTEASEEDVKRFIETLWSVRYQFDRWVIKWVERDDSDDEQLRLTYISRSKSGNNWYINRSQKELSELVMLQSVRNFTGERSAQYWLTPFLSGLMSTNVSSEDAALILLEKIDNELSLAGEGETQKTASFKQVLGGRPSIDSWYLQADYFKESRGTGFEHYWFQKLEYLLWKGLKSSENDFSVSEKKRFKGYRVTAKNSVEHVFPQHEEYQRQISLESLNAFGNLVLLSPGENSSYSNQAAKKKKVDFESKASYDSLKLKYIFDLMGSDEWDEDKIKLHQDQMLSILASHYVWPEEGG